MFGQWINKDMILDETVEMLFLSLFGFCTCLFCEVTFINLMQTNHDDFGGLNEPEDDDAVSVPDS